MEKRMKNWMLIGIITFISIFLRLYHVNFGLPHSFHADEPEITELAIKYTYEIRDIIGSNNWYKLIPISYVYGTFPTYILTFATMAFSKFNGLLGIRFEKMHIYVFLRTLTALISLIIIPVTAINYKKIFKNKLGTWITAILLALNWKLIVHAHYVNMDIFLTVLISATFLTIYNYYKDKKVSLMVVLTGVFYGFAVGTKITALITLPLYLYIFLSKKDYRSMFAFIFIIISTFMLTNPFSIIFPGDFTFRIYQMLAKEGGLVFDSVNLNPFKYLIALGYILTIPVFVCSILGIIKTVKAKKDLKIHLFYIGNILIYLVFYSIQNRRVDRWMLPIVPMLIIYAVYGFQNIKKIRPLYLILAVTTAIIHVYFIAILLIQFQRHTPKSAAYIWMKNNLPINSNKLVYTEEGLDPINKLPGARVIKYNVYESEAAQFFVPENPIGYEYIVLASKPMENYKRLPVMIKYYFYYEKWRDFYQALEDPTKYELIKTFELPEPNLVRLSNVYIYKNLNPSLD